MSQSEPIRRPTFHPRQIVTADDLNAGVAFLNQRLRRHNRYLHGCGVACGLEVIPSQAEFDIAPQLQPLALTIQPGQAISPQGDPIQLLAPVTLAFDHVRTSSNPNVAPAPLSSVLVETQTILVYVLLRYAARPQDSRPLLPENCPGGANQAGCARLEDGFEIELSTLLPGECKSAVPDTRAGILDELLRYDSALLGTHLADFMHCPPGDDQPWVVLATLQLAMLFPRVHVTVHYRDRSLLPSARLLLDLLRCFPDPPRIDTLRVTQPPFLFRVFQVHLTGKGFTPFKQVIIDDPRLIALPDLSHISDTELAFSVFIPRDVRDGRRNFSIITEYDTLESAKYGLALEIVQRDLPAYPYSYRYRYASGAGAIGGGNF